VKDYLSIGSSPSDETCAQVGADNYPEQSRKECRAFLHQLERAFPNPPDGCYLAVKSFEHDFGTYREVVCYFDDESEESRHYAFNMENNTPENWDAAAIEEMTGIKSKVVT
jgi:hypothetical protein